jgi:CRP/FNR family transcriptional regulator, cyclic AMP receptor protein
MDRHALLKGIYLFRDATGDDLDRLAEIGARKEYINGDVVFNEGDEADAMFVVEMGTVDMVAKGKDLVFATIGTGQAFGEVAFFTRGKRPGSARTREVSRILRIPFDRLEALLAGRPALATSFYRNACGFLAKHLRSMAADLNRRYF